MQTLAFLIQYRLPYLPQAAESEIKNVTKANFSWQLQLLAVKLSNYFYMHWPFSLGLPLETAFRTKVCFSVKFLEQIE